MGFSKSSTKRKVHNNTSLPQETRETSITNNLTLQLKQLEKEVMNPKVSRRKEIIKIKEEIKRNKTIAKSKTKSWFFEKINKIDKLLARLMKKKKRKRIKSTKLEMKTEKSQQTTQKYEGS